MNMKLAFLIICVLLTCATAKNILKEDISNKQLMKKVKALVGGLQGKLGEKGSFLQQNEKDQQALDENQGPSDNKEFKKAAKLQQAEKLLRAFTKQKVKEKNSKKDKKSGEKEIWLFKPDQATKQEEPAADENKQQEEPGQNGQQAVDGTQSKPKEAAAESNQDKPLDVDVDVEVKCPRLCQIEATGKILSKRRCFGKAECTLLGEVTLNGQYSKVSGCLQPGESAPDFSALFSCMTKKACFVSSTGSQPFLLAPCDNNASCDFAPMTMMVNNAELSASFCQPPLWNILNAKSEEPNSKGKSGLNKKQRRRKRPLKKAKNQ